MLTTTMTLGPPWIEEAVSMPEEITRTVVDTVKVPVTVSRGSSSGKRLRLNNKSLKRSRKQWSA
jgi:hypothetical protein